MLLSKRPHSVNHGVNRLSAIGFCGCIALQYRTLVLFVIWVYLVYFPVLGHRNFRSYLSFRPDAKTLLLKLCSPLAPFFSHAFATFLYSRKYF